MHRIRSVRFDTDDLDVRTQLLDRVRHASNQAAAAYWDDNRVEFVALFADLESNGAGSGSDVGPLERMYKEPAFFFLDTVRNLECLMDIAREYQVCAIRAACIDPRRISGTDHHDLRGGTDRVGRESRRDSMIAGADSRYAGLALGRRQLGNDCQRSTRFERAGVLQEFQLADNPGPGSGKRLERSATHYRRADHSIVQPFLQRSDHIDRRRFKQSGAHAIVAARLCQISAEASADISRDIN